MKSLSDDIFNAEFDSLLKDYLAETPGPQRDTLRDHLVARCLPYVQKIARGLARRANDPVDDLVQVGCMGLMKALEKFNPLAGSHFKTYATYLITGEIRHYLRDKSAIVKSPRQMYELYYRMNQIIQRLTDDLGRTPTDLEIAQELECSVDKIQFIHEAERRRTIVSLDQFAAGTDAASGEPVYVERLVDTRYFEFLQNQEDKMVLEKALANLRDELLVVVKMTFYDDLSQAEIAKALGVSQMQVSRRLRKALDILYRALHTEHLGAAK